MRILIKTTLFCIALLFASAIHAQDYFRLSADFTTKIKRSEGKSNFTKGKVYYDKFVKDLIYEISFPEKEKWVIAQSSISKIKNDSVYFTSEIPSVNEFTIFHLALNSNLSNFGLNEANFNISKVDRKEGLVISYWNVPRQVQKMISNIVVAKKDNSLYSVIIYGPDNKIINKQFFKDYIKIGGFEFPQTMVQIYYDANQKENYQVIQFKNIILNDMKNEHLYHYQKGK